MWRNPSSNQPVLPLAWGLAVLFAISCPGRALAVQAGSDGTASTTSARQSIGCAGAVIEAVEIVRLPVFPEREGASGWLFRNANRLHVVTRESVVRDELLFATGDLLDPESIEQSARNLRDKRFLSDARIEVLGPDGTPGGTDPSRQGGGACSGSDVPEPVSVRVTTRDSWSTQVETSIRQSGNRTTWSVGVEEKNLLGRGKSVGLGTAREIDRSSHWLGFVDPRVLGSRVRMSAEVRDQSDGRLVRAALARPFTSLDDRWGHSIRLESFDQRQPLYDSGERVAELRHVHRLLEAGLSRRLHRGRDGVVRAHLTYRYQHDDVDEERRVYGVVQVGVTATEHRFVRLPWIGDERAEDVNLGRTSGIWLGLSSDALGGERTVGFLGASHAQGARVGEARFLLGAAEWTSRVGDEGVENGLLRAGLSFVDTAAPRRLFLTSARLTWGVNLDPEVQLRLGADTGLPGYVVNQFVGDRSLVLRAEHRWFVAADVLGLVSLGVAAFADSGYAWPTGVAASLSDLHSDVGVSLLVGRKQSSHRNAGTRIDLAYALDPVPGRGRWLLSFGTIAPLGR